MQHVPWGRVLVTIDWPGWLEIGQPIEARGFEQSAHRALTHAELLGDLAVGLAPAAPGHHLLDAFRRGGVRATMRTG